MTFHPRLEFPGVTAAYLSLYGSPVLHHPPLVGAFLTSIPHDSPNQRRPRRPCRRVTAFRGGGQGATVPFGRAPASVPVPPNPKARLPPTA